jgi:RND family efflux transporter MFP subunit
MMDSKQAPPLPDRPVRSGGVRTARLGFIGLVVVLAMVALFALGYMPKVQRSRELNTAANEAGSARPRVTAVQVRQPAASSELVLPGNTQAIDEVPIHARAEGYLRRRLVDIGDRVKAGQLLAEIETPELDQQISQAQAAAEQARATLAQTQAKLVQSRADLRLADLTLKRWKALVDKGVLARQAGDEKQSDFDAHTADVNAQEANVRAAEANVRAAEANIQRLTEIKGFQRVSAPFAGVITERNVDAGALISGGGNSGKPLFTLAQIGVLRIFVDAPQAYVPFIQPGQMAQVLVQEYPARSFNGKVVRTSSALDQKSHTLLTEVQVANSDWKLLPGMYAQVKFTLRRASPALLIPAEALVIRANGPQVVLLHGGVIHYQRVSVGRDYGTEVEVLSGLTGEERVIINPTDELKEGVAVDVVEQPAAASGKE